MTASVSSIVGPTNRGNNATWEHAAGPDDKSMILWVGGSQADQNPTSITYGGLPLTYVEGSASVQKGRLWVREDVSGRASDIVSVSGFSYTPAMMSVLVASPVPLVIHAARFYTGGAGPHYEDVDMGSSEKSMILLALESGTGSGPHYGPLPASGFTQKASGSSMNWYALYEYLAIGPGVVQVGNRCTGNPAHSNAGSWVVFGWSASRKRNQSIVVA
jgi:hypothetical protein